jgi:hypothetical protein
MTRLPLIVLGAAALAWVDACSGIGSPGGSDGAAGAGGTAADGGRGGGAGSGGSSPGGRGGSAGNTGGATAGAGGSVAGAGGSRGGGGGTSGGAGGGFAGIGGGRGGATGGAGAGGGGGVAGGAGGSPVDTCPSLPAVTNPLSQPQFFGNCTHEGDVCSGTSGGTAWCCSCRRPLGNCNQPLWTCAYLANASTCPATEPASGSACTQPSGVLGCNYCPAGALHPQRCAPSSSGTASVWTDNWIGEANCF